MIRTAVLTTIIALVACLAVGRSRICFADEDSASSAKPAAISSADNTTAEACVPSAAEARERAELLHELVHETLLAVHHHYYREDEGMLLPATTMRGVFEKFAERRKIELRWLAVDAEPMNVEHAARDDFERAAVKALKSGEKRFERMTADEYRYAGPIVLTSECLKCHVPNRTSVRDRMAAIAIRMPRTSLQQDAAVLQKTSEEPRAPQP